MKYRNMKGQFCSREEWLKMGIKKIFVQWLKEYGVYYAYRENVKTSPYWENGKPKYMHNKSDFICSAFDWGSGSERKFWVNLDVRWNFFIWDNKL